MIGIVALGVMAGAGVYSSVQVQLAAERQALRNSEAQLADERLAHAAERQALRNSEAQLAAERLAHAAERQARRSSEAQLAAERQKAERLELELRCELSSFSIEEVDAMPESARTEFMDMCAKYSVRPPCRPVLAHAQVAAGDAQVSSGANCIRSC